jgi:uncharacterized protein (DUF2126 family)/transglutaminase-like putative cysteine protease
MSIRVALHHQTRYRYDRPVGLTPHEIRLRPAPHCRTPVLSYSLNVEPEKHFINWQQDVFGNYIARFVFPEKTRELAITVDLVADMTVINPFDFFVESYAERFPFVYRDDLAKDLAPFLAVEECGPLLARWIADFHSRQMREGDRINDFLVALNHQVQRDVRYLVRMEPGVQSCEQTLEFKSGSCRDSGWLLVQILRRFGLAARFVSGYLIQLAADVKPLDGPAGPERDFTDLHAWAEAYIPGAGWVGLDATSGLLAGEGHLPLACTPSPTAAAPVTGTVDACETQFDFAMAVTRIHEDPRVTKPYDESQWHAINALGRSIDAEFKANDVRLTQGGEPTFVSIDDMDGPEWNTTALSEKKWQLAEQLAWRLHARFAPGGLVFYGQGKWFPGEPLPRWALGVYWRADGEPLWRNPGLISSAAAAADATPDDGRHLALALTEALGIARDHLLKAYEDPLTRLPASKALLVPGGERPAGYVLPLGARAAADDKPTAWASSPWPLPSAQLLLIGGDSSIGYRLPLSSLPEFLPGGKPSKVVRTALCVELRDGRLHVFLPPFKAIHPFLDLIAIVERVAQKLSLKVRVEGYGPPPDPRVTALNLTPDPGVIEVNIHPAPDWDQLAANTLALYEEARATRLGTEKFMLDGRHTGTGGGNHITLGGPTPAESPMLRRPDLLRSLITYWQNHPALSYLFSGMFIGPTSQAPRVDEARDDNLYELEIAFQQMEALQKKHGAALKPEITDRLLRNFLVDLTGNTHRAEFCIDKLYAGSRKLGLVEFRAFEMPPHPHMSLAQMLLLRALVAWFWKAPHAGRLVRWGTQLHDRYLLPHYVAADLHDVVRDLNRAGYALDFGWFAPFIEFRFPRHGTVAYENIEVELRQAIEPWHVLGEEIGLSSTARYVDSSVERLQVRARGLTESRHIIVCNGRALPLAPTGTPGEFVAGVRYCAWDPPSALHPTIGVHAPLVFDVVDTWSGRENGSTGRSIGGCTYHVSHPGGRNPDTFPVNANEAEARRVARFWNHGHTPGPMTVRPEPPNPAFPLTLDLRWSSQ